ncbi:hypothetical protein BDBG_16879 [Blastomyces gilchristii SLH14081]|uniref:Uncharacterized protein n=1 Tax=Blastomyces gilchristii (strain SLH14081) TaxID=559298 RepID=A0A179UI37_BLAGS|nr:uncharacterized protein BDBG_16879 [Blastomyces gilchristii SLH14081]OAT07654.1 hypothetical protein BDBG_16879 [Blastomyces gilchristii SLH14081]
MWQLFRSNHAEELLIPVAIRLAQTFEQREQKPKAVKLLQAIWNDKHPFARRQPFSTAAVLRFRLWATMLTYTPAPPPTLYPLGNRLIGLLGQDHPSFSLLQEATSKAKREFNSLPVVKIGQQSLSNFEGLFLSDTDFEEDGIQFVYRREKRNKGQIPRRKPTWLDPIPVLVRVREDFDLE